MPTPKEWMKSLGAFNGKKLTPERSRALLGMSKSSWEKKNSGDKPVMPQDLIIMALLANVITSDQHERAETIIKKIITECENKR